MHPKHLKKIILVTLVAVYCLIFIGSLVRATGSGMGCPDWPTCFGQLIPPTSIEDIPANYKELYPFYQDADFNPAHTWMEYFNRLSGVTIGFLMLLSLIFAIKARAVYPKTAKAMAATFLLTGFQGWLGSVVVSSHLSPLMISLHMFFAQSIALLLIYSLIHATQQKPIAISFAKHKWLYLALVVLIVQMTLGLITRGVVDELKNSTDILKSEWVFHLPLAFDFHRIFSVVVVVVFSFALLHLLNAMKNEVQKHNKAAVWLMKKMIYASFLILIALFVIGISLVRFDFYFLLQPIHLTLASILLGLCFSLILLTRSQLSNQVGK